MYKVWIGPEMEGTCKNEQTLFVCSDRIIQTTEVVRWLDVYSECKRVYLGAGRTSFTDFDDRELFFQYIQKKGINVLIEVNIEQYSNYKYLLDKDYPITVIFTCLLETPTKTNIIFKTDDYKMVNVYENSSKTDLCTLNGMMYDVDVLLDFKER